MASFASVVGLLGTLARESALWGGVLLLLVGSLLFYRGWNHRQLREVVDATPRSDISHLRSPKTVRIRGKIVPRADRDTFTSPFKGDENCVLSAWEIQEKYDTPKTESWEKSAWGVHAVPFYVSDGTERVLVDVDDEVIGNETSDVFTPESVLASKGISSEGLRCEFEEFDVHVETGYEDSPPRRVTGFVERTDGISSEPMATALGNRVVGASKRKYLEQTLRPGDVVSIIGYAAPQSENRRPPGRPSDLVITQSTRTTLRISERPFDEFATGSGTVLFGTLTGIVGLVLLAMRFTF